MLNLHVGHITSTFTTKLDKYEADFVRAYKSYMEKVQKELGYWQKRLDDTLGCVLNDQHIASLQNFINLYMEEAENVNVTLEARKTQYKKLKEEENQSKQEREKLRKEIIEEMKENKEL